MTSLSPMASTPMDQRMMYSDDPPGTGSLFFAGTIMGLAGLMRIVDAIWAFRFKGAVPEKLANGVFGDNLKNYAWAWLIVGLILILSSFLILIKSQFARWVGFISATIMGVSAATWMPYYPVWSLVYIAIAIMVFHALSRYGGREAV